MASIDHQWNEMETIIVPKVGHEARSHANFVYLPYPIPKQKQNKTKTFRVL